MNDADSFMACRMSGQPIPGGPLGLRVLSTQRDFREAIYSPFSNAYIDDR